jgi:hypothetical protein
MLRNDIITVFWDVMARRPVKYRHVGELVPDCTALHRKDPPLWEPQIQHNIIFRYKSKKYVLENVH